MSLNNRPLVELSSYSIRPAAFAPYVERFALCPLDWDTAFFGARMGVIVLQADVPAPPQGWQPNGLRVGLSVILGRAQAQGYAHVILRTPSTEHAVIWAAESVGLRLVDVGVDSRFDLARTPLPDAGSGVVVRQAQAADLPALCDLAGTAFVWSRFAADPFFTPAQVTAFHRQWIANLYDGLAQVVLVAEADGAVAGFVTCALKGDAGRIPLIATHAGYRRRGIGRALVAAALDWFARHGARAAYVKTQAHNYPALALYHQAGFTVSLTELTFSVAFSPQPAGGGSGQ